MGESTRSVSKMLMLAAVTVIVGFFLNAIYSESYFTLVREGLDTNENDLYKLAYGGFILVALIALVQEWGRKGTPAMCHVYGVILIICMLIGTTHGFDSFNYLTDFSDKRVGFYTTLGGIILFFVAGATQKGDG